MKYRWKGKESMDFATKQQTIEEPLFDILDFFLSYEY